MNFVDIPLTPAQSRQLSDEGQSGSSAVFQVIQEEEENAEPHEMGERGQVGNVLRFAPLLVPIVAVAVAVQANTIPGYIYLAVFMVALIIVSGIVKLTKKVFKQPRPEEGRRERCGVIWESKEGGKPSGCGMPSGHSAISGLVLSFGLLLMIEDWREGARGDDLGKYGRIVGAVLLVAFCLLVMIHRYIIRCHTIPQIIVGGIIGICIGAAGFFVGKHVNLWLVNARKQIRR